MFSFFQKQNMTTPSMKHIAGDICPKCGDEAVFNVEGIADISRWCITCGWKAM